MILDIFAYITWLTPSQVTDDRNWMTHDSMSNKLVNPSHSQLRISFEEQYLMKRGKFQWIYYVIVEYFM